MHRQTPADLQLLANAVQANAAVEAFATTPQLRTAFNALDGWPCSGHLPLYNPFGIIRIIFNERVRYGYSPANMRHWIDEQLPNHWQKYVPVRQYGYPGNFSINIRPALVQRPNESRLIADAILNYCPWTQIHPDTNIMAYAYTAMTLIHGISGSACPPDTAFLPDSTTILTP